MRVCVSGLVFMKDPFLFVGIIVFGILTATSFSFLKRREGSERAREQERKRKTFTKKEVKLNAQDSAIISNNNDTLIIMPLVSCVVVTYSLYDASISPKLILSMRKNRKERQFRMVVSKLNIKKCEIERTEYKYECF